MFSGIMEPKIYCIGEMPGNNEMLPFHKFGRDTIYRRFEKLREALQGCPELELQNSLDSPGGYAWVHCHGDNPCATSFNSVNLYGWSGTSFGTSNYGILFIASSPFLC